MRLRPRVRLAPDDIFRLLVLLVLFGIVLVLALATDVFDEITPREVHAWVRGLGVWAPAAYLGGFVLRPLTLVPLTLWLVAGGIAFGWSWGALYAVLGVNLGAAAEFLAARALGREFVLRLLKRRGGLRRPPKFWGARAVLSLQLLPFMPHDLLNAAAACSTMPYWRFLVGSSLGTLPALVLYTYAGSVLMAPGSKRFYAVFAALAALSLTSLAATRWMRRDEDEEEEAEGGSREAGLEVGTSAQGGARP
jgi:uncharacterized membrane protein YdjX (TVP38/TMEM64 family)